MASYNSMYPQLPELTSRSTTVESKDLQTPDEDLATLLDQKTPKKKPSIAFQNHVDTLTALEARRLAEISAENDGSSFKLAMETRETFSFRDRVEVMYEPREEQNMRRDDDNDDEDSSDEPISSRDTFDSLLGVMNGASTPNRPSLYTLSNTPLLDELEGQGKSELRYFDSFRSSLDEVLASPEALSTNAVDLTNKGSFNETPQVEDYTLFSLFKSQLASFTLRTAFYLTFKLFVFVPWCALVGGCIILKPKSLHKLAFFYACPTPTGIKRYAHWADVTAEHTMIFSGFILALCLFSGPTFSAIILSTLILGAFLGWQDFKWTVDPDVPLGSDDRTSAWMILTGFDLSRAKLEVRAGEVYVCGGDVMIRDEDEDGDGEE